MQEKLPNSIFKLQDIFIASFSINVYVIKMLANSLYSLIPGLDGLCLKNVSFMKTQYQKIMLYNTKYSKSKKNIKIKKDVPKRAKITDKILTNFKNKVLIYNLNLCFKLLKIVNVKNSQKNYKVNAVKRIWVLEMSGRLKPLDIPSLRDRILQNIIKLALLPVIKFQRGSLCFTYNQHYSLKKVIIFIYKRLKLSCIASQNTLFYKVNYDQYQNFIGKKARFIKMNVGNTFKYRRRYLYNYWIFFKKRKKSYFRPYYVYLNINVINYLHNMSYNCLLKILPLSSKYLYLIKLWFNAPIIQQKVNTLKTIKWLPEFGISEGSPISFLYYNAILNDMQDYIFSRIVPNFFSVNFQVAKFIKKNFIECKFINNILKFSMSLYVIRYLYNIFIFGLCNQKFLKQVQNLLIKFFRSKVFFIQNLFPLQKKIFFPGQHFVYLGFRFIFPDYTQFFKFNKGKYTKTQYNSNSIASNNFSFFSQSSIFILIDFKYFQHLKLLLKKQFNRINSYLPVSFMICKINFILYKYLNYFLISSTIKRQLFVINNLLHKLFYNYLLRKYSSMPKIYSYIKHFFIINKKLRSGLIILLGIHDIKFFCNLFLNKSIVYSSYINWVNAKKYKIL